MTERSRSNSTASQTSSNAEEAKADKEYNERMSKYKLSFPKGIKVNTIFTETGYEEDNRLKEFKLLERLLNNEAIHDESKQQQQLQQDDATNKNKDGDDDDFSSLEEKVSLDLDVKDGPPLWNVGMMQLAALIGNTNYLRAKIDQLKKQNKLVTKKSEKERQKKEKEETAAAAEKENKQEQTEKEGKTNTTTADENDENILLVPANLSSGRSCGDGRSLTEYACRGGHIDVLRLLHKERLLDFYTTNDNGTFPAFIMAQEEANIDAFKFAHEECGMPLSQRTDDAVVAPTDGLHVLIIAIRFERMDTVRYLLSRCKEDEELKKSLLEATCTIRTSKGVELGTETPFTVACGLGTGNVDLVRMLYEAGAHNSTLKEAREHAKSMKIVAVSQQVADEACKKDPHKVFRKFNFFPALPDAACTKLKEQLQQQERNGDDISHKKTAIQLQKSFQLSGGGDRSECNSPLHVAVGAKDLPVIKFLCETAGFDIDKDAVVGIRTPLMIAARQGYNDICEYLISVLRCDVNKRSKDQSFPLYTAAFQGNNELVKMLLRANANTTFTWSEATPFFAAVSQSHIETAKILFENKADVSTQFQQRTPCQYAKERGLQEMASFLEENRIY